jgi:AraC family transcriptional regulator of adaptative response / DNA-3-methyladenine glycosylase II
VSAFGERIETPFAELTHLTPTAERVAAASAEEITALGVVRSRALGIVALATEIASGRLTLDTGARPEETIARLVELPGVGPWTAHYVAMRALRWPDAFPKEDLVLRDALGGVNAARAEEMSQAWRPWRSYAVMHLWRGGKSERGKTDGAFLL